MTMEWRLLEMEAERCVGSIAHVCTPAAGPGCDWRGGLFLVVEMMRGAVRRDRTKKGSCL